MKNRQAAYIFLLIYSFSFDRGDGVIGIFLLIRFEIGRNVQKKKRFFCKKKSPKIPFITPSNMFYFRITLLLFTSMSSLS